MVKVRDRLSGWVGLDGDNVLLQQGQQREVTAEQAAAHPEFFELVTPPARKRGARRAG